VSKLEGNLEQDMVDGQTELARTAVVSRQGRRSAMEDTHVLIPDFVDRGWLFGGVFDGHAGSFAAEFAAERLYDLFAQEIESGSPPEAAFVTAYQRVSRMLEVQQSGTTAATFLLRPRDIVAANVGDSRILLVRRDEVLQLTRDHRLEDLAELSRIREAGGRIEFPYSCKGYRCLMPTRSIGDPYFRSIGVLSLPSTATVSRTAADRMLIAGCDGLFDFLSNAEVAAAVDRHPEPEELVRHLAREVLGVRRGTDNLTVLAVDLGDFPGQNG
jgi:serine/threonine protein phosphatase PrpC